MTPTEVRFQQGAYHPVDDLMVIGECESGERRLHIGVRRNPTITSRNSEFIKLLADYLRMVADHSADIDLDRVRLGLAIAGPHTACQEVAQLAQFARTHRNEKRFRAAIAAPRAMNRKVRGRLGMLDEAVSKAASVAGIPLASSRASGQLSWQLLRGLRVIDLRLEGDDPADQASAIAGLMAIAGNASQATALWRRLVTLSSRYAQTAATVDQTLLSRDLSSQLSPVTPSRTQPFSNAAPDHGQKTTNTIGETRQPWQSIPVADCLPEQVGVHGVSGESDEETRLNLPPYIVRDYDRALRSKFRQLSSQGGLLIAVGASSTGKSRSMYEAVREVCPDWQLLLADSADALRKAVKSGIPGRTVVWLDDTPSLRYLGAGGLTKTEVLALIRHADQPVVVVDMLWPAVYQQLSTVPQAEPEAQANDVWRDAREVLSLAAHAVIDVPDQFSSHEREQAARVASSTGDRRLAEALADNQYGISQHLAGAPQQIKHWEHGKVSQPYGWAVLTAAIDIRRIGIRVPLTVDLLSEAAWAYLTGAQIADASSNWLEAALSHASKKLHGGIQALLPVPGSKIGSLAGYEVADYLQQYASIHRYYEPLPPGLREILSANLDATDALVQLALNTEQCGSMDSAIPLYRRVYTLSPMARWRLPQLLAADSQEKELRELIVLGDAAHARRSLNELLAKQGRENDLRKLSESGDLDARWRLALLLLREGRSGEVRELASEGGLGSIHLDDLLSRAREIIRRNRERDAADTLAAEMLARNSQDRVSSVCDEQSGNGRQRLAAYEGELRRLAGEGSIPARRLLAELVSEQGREADLRAMAAAGDLAAREELVVLLTKQRSGREHQPSSAGMDSESRTQPTTD
ncbi:hypothetical protein KIF24_07580 [Micromonospora sp. Llam7]|uniref:hypothetical protein n=1 Tax=Micromonospora tarapacensis TaxID=2835305 RepID=UPI001C836608|nr:hypothetical protein [Micromonospora tarapacensis]MBX7265902.1 hypothetical protein [Micromonospora tarapacensis]